MIAAVPMTPARCRPTFVVAALANAAVALWLAGCDKGGGPGGAARTDDALIGAWRKAGLEVSARTPVVAAPYSAVACRGGTVSGVDVVLCSYDSGEDATAAEELGLKAVGPATGASLSRGTRLLVVADRRKSDPTGRTIDSILRAFRT
jgi:hypothetical protein